MNDPFGALQKFSPAKGKEGFYFSLPRLAEAGLGVAFHAKPAVAAAAHARIDHADLTALLYAQGYRIDEFAPD